METKATTFTYSYHQLLDRAMDSEPELNKRTGVRVRAIEGGASFKVDLETSHVPEPGNRKVFPHIAAAELAWQFMGTQDASFIMAHAPKMWSKFLKTGDATLFPLVETAYGWRWRRAFGRDQLGDGIRTLMEDPSSRQVWIQAWDPANDGLGHNRTVKNIPCPVGFSLTTSGEDLLHCSVFLRSSDLYVGLPYDVMCYALLTDAVAQTLGRRPGSLHVTLAHAHLYEPHWDMVIADLRADRHAYGVQDLPRWTVAGILEGPENYVKRVKWDALQRNPQHPVQRLPELVE